MLCFTLQRYFVNEAFNKPDGPVFLMIGGEGPASPAWMQYGTWLTYAEKLGALCLMLEHRFYGKSHPTTYVCSFCEVVASVALWHSHLTPVSMLKRRLIIYRK